MCVSCQISSLQYISLVAREDQDPSWPRFSLLGLIIFSVWVLVGIQLSLNILQHCFFCWSPSLPLSSPCNSDVDLLHTDPGVDLDSGFLSGIWVTVGTHLAQGTQKCSLSRNPGTRHSALFAQKWEDRGTLAATKEETFWLEVHPCVCVCAEVAAAPKIKYYLKIQYSAKTHPRRLCQFVPPRVKTSGREMGHGYILMHSRSRTPALAP